MTSKRVINYKCHKKIKCIHQEALRRTYIIKCTSDNKLYLFTEYDSSNMEENMKKDAKVNAQLLKQLEHPNILKTKAFYEAKNAKVCIVTNYIPGESLSDKIKAQKDQFFYEDQILDWFAQICLTLKYLHSKNILFRNLCTQNLFVTPANTIKVQDIAVSRLLSYDQEQVMPYQAPEVIDTDHYNSKSDIWSLGVVLYELCALSRPFKGDSLMDLAYFGILVGKYEPIPIRFSKEMSDLVTSLLQVQSEKRPRIDAVLENPIIKARIEQFSTENIKSREDLYESARKQVLAC